MVYFKRLKCFRQKLKINLFYFKPEMYFCSRFPSLAWWKNFRGRRKREREKWARWCCTSPQLYPTPLCPHISKPPDSLSEQKRSNQSKQKPCHTSTLARTRSTACLTDSAARPEGRTAHSFVSSDFLSFYLGEKSSTGSPDITLLSPGVKCKNVWRGKKLTQKERFRECGT